MARVSRCNKLTEHERLRLVGRIGEGVSWRDLAEDFGIPAATIHEWAERKWLPTQPDSKQAQAG